MTTNKVFPRVVVCLLVVLWFGGSWIATAGESKKMMKKEMMGKVNINTAAVEELTQLEGVGKKLAATIVEYREKNGLFQSVEDLAKVKGIGKKIVEQNKEHLCVGNDC